MLLCKGLLVALSLHAVMLLAACQHEQVQLTCIASDKLHISHIYRSGYPRTCHVCNTSRTRNCKLCRWFGAHCVSMCNNVDMDCSVCGGLHCMYDDQSCTCVPVQCAAGGTGCSFDDASCADAAAAGSCQRAQHTGINFPDAAAQHMLTSRGLRVPEFKPVRHTPPLPLALAQRGFLQLGRLLNAPFRFVCYLCLQKQRLALTSWSQAHSSEASQNWTWRNLARWGFFCQVASGWQARGAAAAAGCRRGGADVPRPARNFSGCQR